MWPKERGQSALRKAGSREGCRGDTCEQGDEDRKGLRGPGTEDLRSRQAFLQLLSKDPLGPPITLGTRKGWRLEVGTS